MNAGSDTITRQPLMGTQDRKFYHLAEFFFFFERMRYTLNNKISSMGNDCISLLAVTFRKLRAKFVAQL